MAETSDITSLEGVGMQYENKKGVPGEGTIGFETDVSNAVTHPRDSLPSWKWRASLCLFSMLTLVFGYDISNVANIQASLYDAMGHIDLLPWVPLATSTSTLAIIPLVRRAIEIFDMRLLMIFSLVLFIAGNVVAGAASQLTAVIVGRTVLGVGTCFMYQTTLAYISIFGHPIEVPKIMALIGMVYSIGLVCGPIVGGAFAENSNTTWRWAFYINLPFLGVGLAGCFIALPSYRTPTKLPLLSQLAQVDWIGAALHIISVVLFNIIVTFSGPVWAWSSWPSIAVWSVWSAVFVTYIIQQYFALFTTPERRIFPAHLLKNRAVGLISLGVVGDGVAQGLALYYLPLLFAFARGYQPLAAAVRLLPYIGTFIAASVISGGLLPVIQRYNFFFFSSGVFITVAGGLLSQVSVTTSTSAILGYGSMLGFGIGLTLTHSFGIVNAALPASQRLDSGALINMAQIGSLSIGLDAADTIFQNVGFAAVQGAVWDSGTTLILDKGDIRETLAGFSSKILLSEDHHLVVLVINAVTKTIAKIFYISLAAGILTLVSSVLMKWEKLDFRRGAKADQG